MPKRGKQTAASTGEKRLGRLLRDRLNENKQSGEPYERAARRAIDELLPELHTAHEVVRDFPDRMDALLKDLGSALGVVDRGTSLILDLAGDIGEGWDRATMKQRVAAALISLSDLNSEVQTMKGDVAETKARAVAVRFDPDNPYEPVATALIMYGNPALADLAGEVIAAVAVELEEVITDEMWDAAVAAANIEDEIDLGDMSTAAILDLLSALLGDDEMVKQMFAEFSEDGWTIGVPRLDKVISTAVDTTSQVAAHLIVDCMKSPSMIRRWASTYQQRPQGGMFAGLSGGALEAVEGWEPEKKLIRRVTKKVEPAVLAVFRESFGMDTPPPWAGEVTAALAGILVSHAAYACATIPGMVEEGPTLGDVAGAAHDMGLDLGVAITDVAEGGPSRQEVEEELSGNDEEIGFTLTAQDVDSVLLALLNSGTKVITLEGLTDMLAAQFDDDDIDEDIVAEILDGGECSTKFYTGDPENTGELHIYFQTDASHIYVGSKAELDALTDEIAESADAFGDEEDHEPEPEPNKMSPREMGAAAYNAGKMITTYPWPKSDPRSSQWKKGWRAAKAEANAVRSEAEEPAAEEPQVDEPSVPSTVEEFFAAHAEHLPDYDALTPFQMKVLPLMLEPYFAGGWYVTTALNNLRQTFGMGPIGEPEEPQADEETAEDLAGSHPPSEDEPEPESDPVEEPDDEQADEPEEEVSAEGVADSVLASVGSPPVSDIRKMEPRAKYRRLAKKMVRWAGEYIAGDLSHENLVQRVTNIATREGLAGGEEDDTSKKWSITEKPDGRVIYKSLDAEHDEDAYLAADQFKKNNPETAVFITACDGESFEVEV